MRKIISALIIDPEKDKHDYSQIKIDKLWDTYEENIEIKTITNTNTILRDLSDFRGYDCIITIGEDIDFDPLNKLSFEIRKKWIHKDIFEPKDIAYCIMAVFMGNVGREIPQEVELFSIFTCTFNTDREMFKRLYLSLIKQTYNNWNWFILDDSPTDKVINMIKHEFNDPRITVIKNVTNHGSIGFNKHTIAMMCDGKYLVEVDHDDELLPNCLEKLHEAFIKFPDADFVYSYSLEDINGRSVWYGENWGENGWGGGYSNIVVKGKKYYVPLTADITPISIRTIYTQPNHVRCWKKDFYHRIEGHNPEFSILDDAELLIRTFLNGKMCKVSEILYIQYEDDKRGNENGNNTQSQRFKEIQRTSELLKNKYDDAIHARIMELGYNDCAWDNNMQKSNLRGTYKEIPILNYILN